ncbi:MAG: SIMPL domain-containing protein [Chloroflexi bacterium]|nr:SIMPL domain-containing protein [Chloroflexota bacterium]
MFQAKTRLIALGATLALLALMSAACSGGAPAASGGNAGLAGDEVALLSAALASQDGGQQKGLWVTGEGIVEVTPDVAILTVGVEAQETSVAKARSEAAGAMERLFQALKARGVADRDIRTSQFSIAPEYRYDDGQRKQVLVGYRVQNVVTVKLRNLKDVGPIIDEAVAAAGDLARVQGISFTLENPAPQRDQARSEAIRQALAKARQMAADAGIALGKVLFLSEAGGVESPQPVSFRVGLAAAEAGTPISPGELQVRVSVQLVYEIK